MNVGYLAQQEMQLQTPPFDGPANHVRHVVAALTDLGHNVRLLVNQGGRLWRSDDLREFHPVSVRRMDAGPARWFERGVRRAQYELQAPYAAFFESVRFAFACRQELAGANLLYERMSWVSYGGALAARWMGVPLVLENNGDPLADLEAKGIAPQGMQHRLSMELMQRTVNQAAHVVTTGDGWRDQFLRRWRTDPARVTTVENGTELVRLLQRDELRSFSPTLPDGGAPVTLAYVGGFLPWHGIDVLLEALAQVNARRRSPVGGLSPIGGGGNGSRPGVAVKLLIVGAGDGLAEVKQRAAELGLEEQLTFTGRLTAGEFAPLLAQADIGVSPYCGWNEFSGLKILDYKAAGLPAITSGLDGRPSTVSHGRTGLIVPPCDADALRDAILSLCADEECRRQMGRAARLEAEARHSWKHTARQLEAILMEVQEHWRQS